MTVNRDSGTPVLDLVRAVLLSAVISSLAPTAGWSQANEEASFQTQRSCNHTARELQCAIYLRNYDGDTITVIIPGVHPLLGQEIGVRVKGIDTPEMKGGKPCERELAKQARDFVELELSRSKEIVLNNVERDKYFRILADVYHDGKRLAESLIQLGFARPYSGGAKSKETWCR